MRCRLILPLALAALVLCSMVSTTAAEPGSNALAQNASESSGESQGSKSSGSSSKEGAKEESESENSEEKSSDDENASDGSDDSKKEKSEHGSYQWKRSYGGGIEYGLFFTGLDRWNSALLGPSGAQTFDTTALSNIMFALEASLLEGSRLTLFGGVETPFSENPSLMAAYGGLEPAFAFRRNFWELALGFGVGVGSINLSTNDDRSFQSGLVVMRPTIEVRRYFNELIAGYARFGFSQWLPFDANGDGLQIERSSEQISREAMLQEGGVYVALGARFGHYPEHKRVVQDSDGDGLRNDVDDCKQKPEDKDQFEDDDGCPDEDNDGDGIPDDQDDCPETKEDQDGTKDEDGCPDKDNDGDGIPDRKDECPDEAEDKDGYEDKDGCPDKDNDGDGVPDPEDQCSEEVGVPSNNGCPSTTVQIKSDHLSLRRPIEFQAPSDAPDDADEPQTKTALTSDSKEILDVMAEVLAVHPELAKIEIRAHTGPGDEEAKKKESKKRAETVRDYLVDAGVSAGRLTAKGLGTSKPEKPEGADEKKPVSRVEFKITQRSEQKSEKSSSDSSEGSADSSESKSK